MLTAKIQQAKTRQTTASQTLTEQADLQEKAPRPLGSFFV